METAHVIFAAGRIPELIFAPLNKPDEAEPALDTIGWQAFGPYKQPAFYNEIGMMAKGDPLTDYSAAIRAIAAGRRAAASIHKAIYDLPLELPLNVVTPTTPVQNVSAVFGVNDHPRQLMPLAGGQTSRTIELERGFSSEQASREASRCLQCGLICYLHEDASGRRSSSVVAG
jgi:formate dehydrogenase beta subunit